jgi:RND family efflux transporter MFP subunit
MAESPSNQTANGSSPRQGRRLRAVLKGAGVMTIAALCVAAMVGGTLLLHARAEADAPAEPNPPVKVSTNQIALQTTYAITRTFVGRIEAARETQLAFELGGTVIAVAKDEGDTVAAGDTIARLDTAKLEARRRELAAQRKELEARLALAQATSRRQETLQRKGWAADQRFDEARFQVLEVLAAIGRIDAAIESLDVDLAKSVLKAPFAGRVTRRAIDDGAIVAAGTPIVGLIETDGARIRVGLSQSAAAKMKPGTTYPFRVSAREGETATLDATLTRLRPDLDQRSRTVTALFEIAGPTDATFGSVVTLVLGDRIEATGAWVPLAALSEGERGLWTLLAVDTDDAGAVVRREAVEVLHVSDGRAFVRGSMPDGTRFIVNGVNRVTPGQHVALLKAREPSSGAMPTR